MDLNFYGKNLVELNVATFVTKREAEAARKSSEGGSRTSVVRASNRFFRFYLVVDSRPHDLPNVRLLTWLTKDNTWATHAHPGFTVNGKKISA